MVRGNLLDITHAAAGKGGSALQTPPRHLLDGVLVGHGVAQNDVRRSGKFEDATRVGCRGADTGERSVQAGRFLELMLCSQCLLVPLCGKGVEKMASALAIGRRGEGGIGQGSGEERHGAA